MKENDVVVSKLREKYEGSNYITRFMSDEQYLLTDNYINLVIVKQKEIKEKEKNLKENDPQNKEKEFRDERLATYESLHEVSTPIEIKDIFDKQDNNEIKKVLVYGRAGIGKSTLCKYLAIQCQDGNLWSDKFKAVIWIPLRNLLINKPGSTAAVILDQCIDGDFKPTVEMVTEFINNNRSQLLFILDGYDEVAQQLKEEEHKGLKELLKRILKEPAYHVILTSRPTSIKLGLDDETIVTFDKQLENVGFTNENIKQYVQKFYSEDSQKLINFLEQNKSIWGIAHIPINLDLICSVWKPSETHQQTEYTMSKLYIQINKKLIERYLEKFQKVNLDELTEVEYAEKTKIVVEGLEQLAIQGMLNSQIIISSSAVKKVSPEILKSGLIKTVGEGRNNKDKDIYFLHLTFQEFYAASYIAKSLENIGSDQYKKAKELIAEHKYNPYFQVIWWFTTGILYERGKEKDDYLALIRFWHEIESHPRDLIGLQHICLVIKCLDECIADMKITVHKGLMANIARYTQYTINAKQNQGEELYKRLSISPWVAVSHRVISILISALKNKKDYYAISSAAGELGKIDRGNTGAISLLASALKNGWFYIRSIIALVGKITDRNSDSISIPTLKIEDEHVKGRAAYALGKIGSGNREIIDVLINTLKNEKNRMRSIVAEALGNIGNRNNDVILALISTLKDKDKYVKMSVADELSKIGIGNSDVILALINILKDEDEEVRSRAVEALGNIGVGNSDVILALIDTLKEDCVYVRSRAAEALGNTGNGNRDAINTLIEALNNESEDIWVKMIAAEALGKIGNRNSEAIAALINALRDKHQLVKNSVASALGKIESGNNEVISLLIKALKNKDKYVALNAVDVLGKIGNGNRDTIDALINTLKDKQNDNLRWNEETALPITTYGNSEMISLLGNPMNDDLRVGDDRASKAWGLRRGDKTEINLLYSTFVDSLEDKNCNVRSRAAKALGNIGGKNSEVISVLIDALKDEYNNVRSRAAEALGNIGGENSKVISALIDTLKDENNNVRSRAAEALGNIGGENSEVISALIDTLKDEDNNVRSRAVEALGNIGGENSEVISALIDTLKDEDNNVRSRAAEALGNIGGENSEVISALIDTLKDEDNNVRSRAADVLSKLLADKEDNIKQVAGIIDQGSINMLINARIPLITATKCYAISSNLEWIKDLMKYDICIIFVKENSCLMIRKTQSVCKIELRTEQIEPLLNELENQAKEKNLPTDTYKYYRGVGKLGLNIDLGIKELTPLHIAAQEGDLDKIKAILETDQSDIDNQNNEQLNTPLLLAAKGNHWPVAEYLISQKADISCVNKLGEYVLELMLSILPKDNKVLKLALKEYSVREGRLQRLLENAVLNYIGSSKDQTVGEMLSLIAGCVAVDWRNDGNLITTYRMYLENLSKFQIEHQELVKADGQNAIPILAMRLYFYTELYLKLQKSLIMDLPLKEGHNYEYTIQELITKLKEEILIISNTLINAKLNLSCNMLRGATSELIRTLSFVRAEGVLEKLKNAPIGYECSIPTGYLSGGNGHCIYVGLHKLGKNEALVRVDNRWVLPEYKIIYKEKNFVRMEDEHEVIKSYCVGVFKLSEHFELLKEYTEGVIYAFCNSSNNSKTALSFIYGRNLSLPSVVTQFTELVKKQIASWPFHNIQRNMGDNSADNCTLSSHNLGVSVRCGNNLFKWLVNYELQSIPSLNNTNVMANNSLVNRTINLVGDGSEREKVVNFSHTELMKKLQQELRVAWEDIFSGTVVEQALVNMAWINTEQKGAMFRPKGASETEFSLRFSSLMEYNKFINYYKEKFPDLIKEKGVYNAEGLTQVVMDTQLLYNKVVSALGGSLLSLISILNKSSYILPKIQEM